MTTIGRRTTFLMLPLLLASVGSACTSTMYALQAPSPPQSGHISRECASGISKGQTTAELRVSPGEPLDIERKDDGEVWHYRVQTMMKCTTITKRFLGRTTVTEPPEDPYVRVTLRAGLVEGVDIVPFSAVEALR